MQIQINSIQELEAFIINTDLTENQIKEIVYAVVGSYPDPDLSNKSKIIESIKRLLIEYPSNERPLFINEISE